MKDCIQSGLTLILFLINFNNAMFAQDPVPAVPVGSGTSGSPYLINSVENLYWVTQHSETWSKYFSQTNDLDISSSSGWASGMGFSPIGNLMSPYFTGNYNGNGHTITGLYIDRPGESCGMFGETRNGAVITNLGIINANIFGYVAGCLVGNSQGANITNCYSTGSVQSAWSNAGGLIGFFHNDGGSNTMSNCYSTATVLAINGNAGGLIGKSQAVSISNCYSKGNVFSNGDYTGGFVGQNEQSSINNCFSSGDVTGTNYTGGFTGQAKMNSINNCYSLGNVNGTVTVGGFVGLSDNASITNCFSNGHVSGSSYIGGFGGAISLGLSSNCFYNSSNYSGGCYLGFPLSNEEMKISSKFTGWDFTTNPVWAIKNTKNGGYPYLNWQVFNAPITQAKNITFASISENSMTINWDNGNGERRAVFIKAANTGNAIPVNYINYTANSIFGNGSEISSGGWFCIYNGKGTSVKVTGLNAATDYIVQIFEYNDLTGSEMFLTSTGSNNPKVQRTTEPLPVELKSFTAQNVDKGIEIKWSTATEINNYGFQVERKKLNKMKSCEAGEKVQISEWEVVGFVEGSGNSNSPKEYSFLDINPPSGNLQYKLKQIDTDGSFEYYPTIAEVSYNLTYVSEKQLPNEFGLTQNYPNPFNPATIISYQIPVNEHVLLKVYDMLGNEVATLVNEEKQAGYYQVKFSSGSNGDGSNLASGVYVYRLHSGSFTSTKKLMLLK